QAGRVRQRGVPPAQAPRREGREDPRRGSGRQDDQAHQGAGRVHRCRRRGPVQARALPLLIPALRDNTHRMGDLIVVEGLDGAGKRTLSGGLVETWRDAGLRVATLAFPRYGDSIHADLGAEALRGGHGDTAQSVEAMALLWALDRRGAADDIRNMLAENDIVLL